jgi:ubiquitin-activating enzyme E1-like protein 2
MIKYLKDCKLVEFRNSFLNLAVPSLMMSEPGPAQKTKIGSGDSQLEVTLWDRWEYEADSYSITLLKVVDYLESKYKLSVRDVFYGSIPLFMYALQ